jgi:hypothetical protein
MLEPTAAAGAAGAGAAGTVGAAASAAGAYKPKLSAAELLDILNAGGSVAGNVLGGSKGSRTVPAGQVLQSKSGGGQKALSTAMSVANLIALLAGL